jgi:hypothetical protein
MSQPFFDGGEDFSGAARLRINDAIGMKAYRGKRRGEKVPPLQAPQHGPFQPREDAGGEESRARAVLARGAGFHELVNGPERQPVARQVRVDRCNPKRQNGTLPPATLKPLNALAKLRENDVAPGIEHALPQKSRMFDVLTLFSNRRRVNPPQTT